MHSSAIERAQVSLEKAAEAFSKLEQASTFAEFEWAWSDFLVHSNRVFTQLEQGSKASDRSRGWFSRKKGERRSDPLLKYMWEARNADEHGLEQVTGRSPGGFKLSGRGNYKITGKGGGPVTPSKGLEHMDIQHLSGEPPQIKQYGPKPTLKSVKDRSGNVVPVPGSHGRNHLLDQEPLTVARPYLTYVETMFEEAKSQAASSTSSSN